MGAARVGPLVVAERVVDHARPAHPARPKQRVDGATVRPGGERVHVGLHAHEPVHLVDQREVPDAGDDRVGVRGHGHVRLRERRMRRALPVPGRADDRAPVRPVVEADRGGMDGEHPPAEGEVRTDGLASLRGEGERPLLPEGGVALDVHPPPQRVDDQQVVVGEHREPALDVVGDGRGDAHLVEQAGEQRRRRRERVADTSGEQERVDLRCRSSRRPVAAGAARSSRASRRRPPAASVPRCRRRRPSRGRAPLRRRRRPCRAGRAAPCPPATV